jgi:hypothetical protein
LHHPFRRRASFRARSLGGGRRMFIPPPSNPNAKLGFSTYAMWALCVVVVGVCYKLEQDELSARPASLVGIPDTVQKVMPSGAWLMSAPRPLLLSLLPHSCATLLSLAEDGSIQKGS